MKSLRIIIADDDRDFADSLGDLLELKGYKIHVCYNGSDAVKTYSENKIDLCLFDIKMDDMTGIDASRDIRKLDETANIALMTGYSMNDIDGLMNGENLEIIQKPIDLNTLLQLFARIKLQ